MRFSFVTIHVKDLDKSVSFYTDLLGFGVRRWFSPRPGFEIVFLKDRAGGTVELIRGGEAPKDAGDVSLGFAVESLDETLAMLREKGVAIARGPIATPGGPKFAFVRDPDGVEVEFIEGLGA
ncbi:MAG: VOC family protein [Bacteroidota bacterium]